MTQPQKKRSRSVAPTSHLTVSDPHQIVRTPSPPTRSPQALAENHLKDPVYSSPDRSRLHEALMYGGETEIKVHQNCMFVITRTRWSS